MKSGVGHHLITGFVNTFNAKSSYKTAWSAFANSSPAKGSATTPVKAVLGTSFENNTIFT